MSPSRRDRAMTLSAMADVASDATRVPDLARATLGRKHRHRFAWRTSRRLRSESMEPQADGSNRSISAAFMRAELPKWAKPQACRYYGAIGAAGGRGRAGAEDG